MAARPQRVVVTSDSAARTDGRIPVDLYDDVVSLATRLRAASDLRRASPTVDVRRTRDVSSGFVDE
jgi:hypothetical protein